MCAPGWPGQVRPTRSAPASRKSTSTVSAPAADRSAVKAWPWRHAVNPLRVVWGCLATMAAIMFGSCGAQHDRVASSELRLPRFAVFASRTADDELPREVAAALARSAEPEFRNADIEAARRVLALEPVWLVPASGNEVCIVRIVYPLPGATQGSGITPAIAHSCVSEREAQAGRLVTTQTLGSSPSESTRTRVIGVAPDGVAAVTIAASHGLATAALVQRNGYEAVVAGPVSVVLRTYYDHRVVRHTIPLGTVPANVGAPQAGRGDTLGAG